MTYLLVSALSLFLAPLVHRFAGNDARLSGALDGFIFTAISGLVFLHILPYAYGIAGWTALTVAGIGLLLPALLHYLRVLEKGSSYFRLIALMAFAAIGLHAFLDGIALRIGTGAPMLVLAIALHRLPIGIAIWRFSLIHLGVIPAWGSLIFVIVVSAFGYGMGTHIDFLTDAHGLAYFQAFMAGSLAHLAGHPQKRKGTSLRLSRWNISGAFLGTIFMLLIHLTVE